MAISLALIVFLGNLSGSYKLYTVIEHVSVEHHEHKPDAHHDSDAHHDDSHENTKSSQNHSHDLDLSLLAQNSILPVHSASSVMINVVLNYSTPQCDPDNLSIHNFSSSVFRPPIA